MKTKKIFYFFIHALFWVVNYLYITSGNINWNGFDILSGSLYVGYGYGLFFNAFLFYIQAFWLVPAFFIKGKKATFWVLSISLFFVITLLESFLDIRVAKYFNTYETFNTPLFAFFFVWVFHNSIFHIFYSLIGFLYRFQFEYYKSEKTKTALLKETHKTELKYLKAQLNPHFLFNGINSIYHLIGKNNSLAKNTLLQFSGLLRYQLYESNTTYISLEKELEYITQYVQIEEIRKGDDIDLNYTIDFNNSTQKVAPLLLIPFIENAFKHVSNHPDNSTNKIHIQIEEANNILSLKVENTFDSFNHKKIGGVGLVNVKRRLDLLYPEKHQLKIKKEKKLFFVDLKINL